MVCSASPTDTEWPLCVLRETRPNGVEKSLCIVHVSVDLPCSQRTAFAIQEESRFWLSNGLPFRPAGWCCFFAPAEDSLPRVSTLSIAVCEWSFGVSIDELWKQMSDDHSPALVSGFDVARCPRQLHSARQLQSATRVAVFARNIKLVRY